MDKPNVNKISANKVQAANETHSVELMLFQIKKVTIQVKTTPHDHSYFSTLNNTPCGVTLFNYRKRLEIIRDLLQTIGHINLSDNYS